MEFYASIAARVCTIWLGFEPDPDHSPDPGSGHVFKLARQIALKVIDIYFNEILQILRILRFRYAASDLHCYAEFYVWKIPPIRIGAAPLEQAVVLKWFY